MMAALLIIGRHMGSNVTGLLVILGVNFAYGFFVDGISWQGHLGGAIVGALVALIIVATKRRDQRLWQILGLAGLTVALLVIVAFIPPLLLMS
jgi:membrane associated rhomboid family serine protease